MFDVKKQEACRQEETDHGLKYSSKLRRTNELFRSFLIIWSHAHVQLFEENRLDSYPAEEWHRNQEWYNPLQCFFSVKFLKQQWKLLLLVESLCLGIIGQLGRK